MSSYKEITDFFDCYIEWINELFPEFLTEDSMGEINQELVIKHRYAIFNNDKNSPIINKLSNKYGLPDYYVNFLSSYCYRTLEIPLFNFPSTHPNDSLSEICSDLSNYMEFKLMPFASDKHGTGLYCIDLLQDESIVFYQYSEKPSITNRNQKLASSFLNVLSFLKEYLEWGGNLNGLDDEDKKEAIEELRNLDEILNITWENWWYPRIQES